MATAGQSATTTDQPAATATTSQPTTASQSIITAITATTATTAISAIAVAGAQVVAVVEAADYRGCRLQIGAEAEGRGQHIDIVSPRSIKETKAVH